MTTTTMDKYKQTHLLKIEVPINLVPAYKPEQIFLVTSLLITYSQI